MSREPVLSLRDAYKRNGARMVLHGASASFHAGDIYIVTGGSSAARLAVARTLAGQTPLDGGRIERAGPAGPLVGAGMGFNVGGPVARGLELRAAAFDIDRIGYLEAVSMLLDNPEVLRKPIKQLNPTEKAIVQYGASFLLPCTHFIFTGGPLPGDEAAAERLTPLFEATRARAAMICIVRKPHQAAELGVRRLARLRNGQLDILKRNAPTRKQLRARKRAQPDASNPAPAEVAAPPPQPLEDHP